MWQVHCQNWKGLVPRVLQARNGSKSTGKMLRLRTGAALYSELHQNLAWHLPMLPLLRKESSVAPEMFHNGPLHPLAALLV